MMIVAVFAMQAASPQAPLPTWLSSAWASSSGERWTEEWWTPDKGGIMLGASRSGEGTSLAFFEHMRIERTASGLRFCALPQGKAGGCFAMVANSPQRITFESTAHDYPQRITYRREGKVLTAEISLADGSRRQTWVFEPLRQ